METSLRWLGTHLSPEFTKKSVRCTAPMEVERGHCEEIKS